MGTIIWLVNGWFMVRRVTSFEVAELAGVSQSTVSRVFSDKSERVAEATRRKVYQAAEQLGYRPSAIGRMMSTQQSRTVGIVMASITNPFYPYVLEKFLQTIQATERQALLFTASADQDVDDILPLVLSHRVDALIVTSATLSSAMVDEAERAGTAVILFNRYVNDGRVSAVCCDNEAGAREIADLLVESGHHRYAYIAGNENTSTNQDRQFGYVDQLHRQGVHDVQVIQAGYSYDASYHAMQRLLTQSNLPDAIFCANDIMAIGCIDAAREAGLSVPQDLSIVGFDDIPMASWSAYQLTTMSQEVDTMIERTIALMEQRIANLDAPPVLELIPGKMKIRRSMRGTIDV